jgi:hypothetical protein
LGKRALNLVAEPPLGALRRSGMAIQRCVSPADGALGNSEGEMGWGPRCDAAEASQPAVPRRSLQVCHPVTRDLFCPETRAVGLPGAR